ncbi:hypothetical protein [Nostoc sp. JL34]|uniref:hypothetical protein n=1 Tax=Nostoc sp. JL34 TaxID=2815397 RepID=UPI003459159D
MNYEIQESYERGHRMIGIYIHNIRSINGHTDFYGGNPFDNFSTILNGQNVLLSQIYPTYNWVRDDGYNNFSKWIESAAIAIGR